MNETFSMAFHYDQKELEELLQGRAPTDMVRIPGPDGVTVYAPVSDVAKLGVSGAYCKYNMPKAAKSEP